MNRRICFVLHNATRTGAPVVLYRFLKWLKASRQEGIEVIFIEGGEMVSDFEALYPCRVLPSIHEAGISGFLRRLLKRISGRDVWMQFKLRFLQRYDVLFFNTAASFRLLTELPALRNVKLVAWLHEQPFSITKWYANDFTATNLSRFSMIYCVSSVTADWLKTEWNTSDDYIEILKPFVNTEVGGQATVESASECRGSKLMIGGCGIQEMHKGPDLFLQVASYINANHPEVSVEFEWLGSEGGMTDFLLHDIEKMNLHGMVKFPGAKSDTNLFFQQMDLFLLTSRVDSFPMVVLEAAAAGKPVLCFEGIGDITDIVGVLPENVIPYGRTDLMAERVLYYYTNRESISIDGKQLRNKVISYSVENQSHLFWGYLS